MKFFKAGGPDVHDIDIDKLEKLIIRIAIFSVLYTFPGMSLPVHTTQKVDADGPYFKLI